MIRLVASRRDSFYPENKPKMPWFSTQFEEISPPDLHDRTPRNTCVVINRGGNRLFLSKFFWCPNVWWQLTTFMLGSVSIYLIWNSYVDVISSKNSFGEQFINNQKNLNKNQPNQPYRKILFTTSAIIRTNSADIIASKRYKKDQSVIEKYTTRDKQYGFMETISFAGILRRQIFLTFFLTSLDLNWLPQSNVVQRKKLWGRVIDSSERTCKYIIFREFVFGVGVTMRTRC